jgi:hypothetical protein
MAPTWPPGASAVTGTPCPAARSPGRPPGSACPAISRPTWRRGSAPGGGGLRPCHARGDLPGRPELDPTMPVQFTREFTDMELTAMWKYLQTLEPKPFGPLGGHRKSGKPRVIGDRRETKRRSPPAQSIRSRRLLEPGSGTAACMSSPISSAERIRARSRSKSGPHRAEACPPTPGLPLAEPVLLQASMSKVTPSRAASVALIVRRSRASTSCRSTASSPRDMGAAAKA